MKCSTAAAALAAALLALPGVGSAADDALRARAERLAAAGHCEEALKALGEMAARAPLDARAEVVKGQCQIRLERYEEAVASLERARALDPHLPLIDLQLGIARFHAGDSAGAQRAFADARAAGTTRPELDFYEALLRLQAGQDAAATARAFERARRERPAEFDPAASYYAGLAWSSANDAQRAREALQRVIEQSPGTPWAAAAQRALDRLGAGPAAPGLWVRLQAGMEWDSNVAFLGNGLATPDQISSKSDVRGVWSADVGSELWRRGGWALGARAFYYGSAHVRDSEFDLEFPGAAAWVDRETSERSLFRLESGFGYGWLGYDPYVASWFATPQWFLDQGRWGVTRFYSAFTVDNFLSDHNGGGSGFPGSNDSRNRDGWGVIPGIDHRVLLRDGATELRGGVFGEHYDAKGRDWDFWGVGVHGGFRQELPWRLALDTEARYAHRPFSHPSTYEVPPSNHDRSDDFVEVDVHLERPITDRLTASVRYDYLRNFSNVDVFDYDRHLVGAYLTYFWQKRPGAHP